MRLQLGPERQAAQQKQGEQEASFHTPKDKDSCFISSRFLNKSTPPCLLFFFD